MNGKIVQALEYKCVTDLLSIIKSEYGYDKALEELVFIELLDFEYLFNMITPSKYENEMSKTIEKLDNILI